MVSGPSNTLSSACFKPSQIGGDGGSKTHPEKSAGGRNVSSPPKSEGMGEEKDRCVLNIVLCVSSPPKSEGMGEENVIIKANWRFEKFQALPNRRGWGKITISGTTPLICNKCFKPSQIGGDGGRENPMCFKGCIAFLFQALPNRRGWGKIRGRRPVAHGGYVRFKPSQIGGDGGSHTSC